MTEKGQITIPKALRDRLGLRPGDEIEFVEMEGSLRIQKRLTESPFARYRGYLRHLKGQHPDSLVEDMRGL